MTCLFEEHHHLLSHESGDHDLSLRGIMQPDFSPDWTLESGQAGKLIS